MKPKTINQLEYERLHYSRNYYIAKARGKAVIRLQLKKLSQKLKSFRTGFAVNKSTFLEL